MQSWLTFIKQQVSSALLWVDPKHASLLMDVSICLPFVSVIGFLVSSQCCGLLFNFYIVMWQISCIRNWDYKKCMPPKGFGFPPANSKLSLLPRATVSDEWPRNPQPALDWPFSLGQLFRRQFCSVIVSISIALSWIYHSAAEEPFSALTQKKPCGSSGISKAISTSRVKTSFIYCFKGSSMKHKTAMR